MRNIIGKSFLIILILLLLSGCGVQETPTVDPAPPEEEEIQEEAPTEEVQVEEAPTEEVPSVQEIDPEAIFADRCARCHGADRSGGRGPALLPERLTKDAASYETIIANGSGGMPSFSSKLTSEEINALVEFILSAP